MAQDPFLTLVKHRWALPALAHIWQQGGTRFSVVRRALGLSRDGATAVLRHLVACGLVLRATEHAHPLTPEYRLSHAGAELAPICAAAVEQLAAHALFDVGLRKWSLPILAVVDDTVPVGFSDLRRHIGAVTPRALSLGLDGLCGAGVVLAQRPGYVLPPPVMPLHICAQAVQEGARALI